MKRHSRKTGMLLWKLFFHTHAVGPWGPEAPKLPKMSVRGKRTLNDIRKQYGSPFGAALNGAINAEEYLRMDSDD